MNAPSFIPEHNGKLGLKAQNKQAEEKQLGGKSNSVRQSKLKKRILKNKRSSNHESEKNKV